MCSAFADKPAADPRSSVLLVDSSLGDFDAFKLHWLGNDAVEVANNDDLSLLSADDAIWWNAWNADAESATPATSTGITSGNSGSAQAPATFLLGSSSLKPVEAKDIVWALDEIAKTGANPKALIVSVGSSGLQTRLYAEDLAETKQSTRADLVGMVFLGTPHQGYSTVSKYPKLSLWSTIASASNLTLEDIQPNSDFIKQLNASPFPNIVKSLQINGQIGDLGFGLTDGAAIQADMAIPDTVSSMVQVITSKTTISQNVGLSSYWLPLSKADGQAYAPVDAKLAERLSAMDSYVTLAEIQAQTKQFYQAWFADGAPVTHVSSVLTLDLSGSMGEALGDQGTKLDAAQSAAKSYIQAVHARSKTSFAVPSDVTVLGFNTNVSTIAAGSDDQAVTAIDSIQAKGETDVGKALDSSLDTISSAPTNADKRILFLSDGISTQGMSNSQILTGPVQRAKDSRVTIDTIAFGNMGQSDIDFLREIATGTGGTFYESTDYYGLNVSFLKSYYSSLGLSLFDSEANPSAGATTVLGTIGANTRSIEIGVLADGEVPEVELLCNGSAVDPSSYTTQTDNASLLTLQIEYPQPGEYSMVLNGASNRAHVFVVGQLNLNTDIYASASGADYSILFIIGACIVLIVALIAIIITSLVSRRKSKASSTGSVNEFQASAIANNDSIENQDTQNQDNTGS
jgi:hypothetical protein